MEVTNRLLSVVGELLSKGGLFYLVGIEENDPEAIIKRMQEVHGMEGVFVKREQVGIEGLFVVRFIKPH